MARERNPPALTKRQVRELESSIRDGRDPRRYILQDNVGLFYDVQLDEWAVEPEDATRFKRRKFANAVLRVLRATDRERGAYRVLRVKLLKNGRVQLPRGTMTLLGSR